jgi:hypothetical protein
VKHLLILRRLSVEGNDWNTVTQLVRKGIDWVVDKDDVLEGSIGNDAQVLHKIALLR